MLKHVESSGGGVVVWVVVGVVGVVGAGTYICMKISAEKRKPCIRFWAWHLMVVFQPTIDAVTVNVWVI